MTNPLSYSVVIATRNRLDYLRQTVESLLEQSRHAVKIVVVDASQDGHTALWVASRGARTDALIYRRSPIASAACQRNLGADEVDTDLIAFVDDDVELPVDLMAKLIAPFEGPDGESVGGVAGRISGLGHRRPSLFLYGIYRLMAGYADPHYGARLFGAALNTLPCYEEQKGLVPSEWLNSTCVIYRNELFQNERFPEFDGYSYLEDVHLSARIAKTHRLYFHSDAIYAHHSAGSSFKQDKAELAAMAMRNRRIVAWEIMGLGKWTIAWKQLLHRLLNTAVLMKMRSEGWRQELEGTWRH
jgi:GT2 family glycosyltransferase